MSSLLTRQEYIDAVRSMVTSSEEALHRPLTYYVDTYGCQQNESDSELLRGLCEAMGYSPAKEPGESDLVLFNTCAVREHAEQRVLGNVGTLSHAKKKNPEMIILLCGCMVGEEHVREKIKKSFPYVSGTLDTGSLDRLPQMIYHLRKVGKRTFYSDIDRDVLTASEGLPRVRDGKVKAWLPIMKGCNNFCSYCIVPYVRGREASRDADCVVAEAAALVEAGYKEITLLGQNVNSYKGIAGGFPELLKRVNAIPGDFRLRFMTSHPKDAGEELFRAMSQCEKLGGNLHLPFQSGSDRILQAMNRRYTSSQYLEKIDMARRYMPWLDITADVIVGFPGETEEDFLLTEDLVKKAGFYSLFTFIYSRRKGTKAATIPDDTPLSVIKERFTHLVALQDSVSAQKNKEAVGKVERCLYDGFSREKGQLTARTSGGRLVLVAAPAEKIGSFGDVKITSAQTWSLTGLPADNL